MTNIHETSIISPDVKIGDNVKIGGGSGVVKDIPDNITVMGYPAVPLKDFLKKDKKNKLFEFIRIFTQKQ